METIVARGGAQVQPPRNSRNEDQGDVLMVVGSGKQGC
jgi:hypothetical protein